MKPRRATLLLAFLGLLGLAGLCACLPAPQPLPPTETPTPPPPTATLTPTIVWFPPTATLTPLPTVTHSVTATLDLSPRYGALTYSDDFSQDEHWNLGRQGAGSVALGLNELTLAVTQERGYLSSLHQELYLSDFYAEITASPSLCRGADEYGLLLRASGSLEFFRFALLCNGQARLDRFYQGTASSPVPPAPFGFIPPGAPSASRLAVWAVGKDLRFYANGQFLFAVRDSTLPAGGLGVFVRSAGANAVTVNFSDLKIYQPAP